MKKIIAILLSVIGISGATVMAQEDAGTSGSELFQQFEQFSELNLAKESNPFSSPSVFIEHETAQQLIDLKSNTTSLMELKGQWSVSFDLNRLGLREDQLSFGSPLSTKSDTSYNWELGTSLVSPDETSRFYVNYGNRKVPISISFDDIPTIAKSDLNLGFEQQFNESWAVSISYLKAEQELGALSSSALTSDAIHQLDYLFDFDNSNRLETVNFSPFGHQVTGTNFLDDISAIQIKVSRQVSDSLSLSARASQQDSSIFNDYGLVNSSIGDDARYQAQQLALEGRYRLNDSWSLGANVEHQVEQFSVSNHQNLSNFSPLDTTTLDIGVQYQSHWDQVGVVIRIDLMNLLGAGTDQSGHLGMDQNGLKPFSFESPKYIKVSGSINF